MPRSDSLEYKISKETIQSLIDEKKSLRDIAKIYMVSISSICRLVAKYKLNFPNRYESLKNKRQHIINCFDSNLTENESWLLGFIYTDGCLMDNNRLQISVTDKDGVEKALQIIGCGSIRQISNNNCVGKTLYNYSVMSEKLSEKLKFFGVVPRKTKLVEFPMNSGLKLQHFIRGLFDGDGSWGVDRRDDSLIASFCSASYGFIKFLHELLKPITKSKAQIRKRKEKEFWVISYQGKSAVELANYLYQDNFVCLNRKYEVVKRFLNTSQNCSSCGELVKKDLSVRSHHCTSCGLTLDRDENAAKNILALGLESIGNQSIEAASKLCLVAE